MWRSPENHQAHTVAWMKSLELRQSRTFTSVWEAAGEALGRLSDIITDFGNINLCTRIRKFVVLISLGLIRDSLQRRGRASWWELSQSPALQAQCSIHPDGWLLEVSPQPTWPLLLSVGALYTTCLDRSHSESPRLRGHGDLLISFLVCLVSFGTCSLRRWKNAKATPFCLYVYKQDRIYSLQSETGFQTQNKIWEQERGEDKTSVFTFSLRLSHPSTLCQIAEEGYSIGQVEAMYLLSAWRNSV